MLIKLEWLGYRTVKKNYDDMLSRFHLIPERHWQTDRQTDRIAISILRISVLSRDKKRSTLWLGGETSRSHIVCVLLVFHFCRAMLASSEAFAVMRCLSVCPSVTFVSCVKMNKHIIKIFSPLGSPTILVYPYQTAWQYSDGNPPNGASNAGGVG